MPAARRGLPVRRTAWLLVFAILLTLVTALYQRRGARFEVVGEGFCPGRDPCSVEVLGAGLPFPYWVDNPQVSVANSLNLVEDDFRFGFFLLDVGCFLIVLLVADRLRRRRPDRSDPHRDGGGGG